VAHGLTGPIAMLGKLHELKAGKGC